MKPVTLTPDDLAQFADDGRHALGLFLGQYAQLAPKFHTVTDEAVAAMVERVAADPVGIQATPGIDHAVYLAALFRFGASQLDAAIKALEHDPDAAALHSLMQQTTACANVINALTLLRDGLLPQLHLDEAQRVARSDNARTAALAMHAATADAKAWVLSEWVAHRAEYGHNKTKFARVYAPRVKRKYPKARGNAETIKDDWLPKS